MWRRRYSHITRKHGTSEAGVMSLMGDGAGIAEDAMDTAGNATRAVCDLVEILEGKGFLTGYEVKAILQLHMFEEENT